MAMASIAMLNYQRVDLVTDPFPSHPTQPAPKSQLQRFVVRTWNVPIACRRQVKCNPVGDLLSPEKMK